MHNGISFYLSSIICLNNYGRKRFGPNNHIDEEIKNNARFFQTACSLTSELEHG